MGEAGGRRAAAGGARTAGGVSFQAQVFAYWASRSVTGRSPLFGLDPAVRIEAVGCETGFPVDDIGLILSDGGYILIQAKGGMARLDVRATDLRSAARQLVTAFRDGIRGEEPRPIDSRTDRLVLATNESSSRTFDELGKVCARMRDHPAALSIEDAGASEPQRKAIKTFVSVLRSRWLEVAGSPPTEDELRLLLRVVEVVRHDFAADGADRTRSEVMLEHIASDGAFDRLVLIGVEAARERSWRSRDTLRLVLGGGHGGAEPDRNDIDRLIEQSRRTLERLGGHTRVHATEGPIHVERRIVSDLRHEADGFLITGVPGVGKSGVLAALADLDRGDKLVLSVDSVPVDRALAQVRWKLSADLVETLRSWEGQGRATLYLDGLDAHRGGPSWLADLVEDLRGSRWRVVASIRRFELLHSRRWQQQFQGAAIGGDSPADTALDGVRHVVIQPFDDHELAVVVAESATIAALLDVGGDQLQDLLANPFNLSLAAEMVGQVPVERLAAMQAQVQLLAQYWRVRVEEESGHYARSNAVRTIVDRMVTARALETGIQGLPADALSAVEELVSRGVLDEVADMRLVRLTKTIRFRHHIVFDFALAAALLGPGGQDLAGVLANDPDFVVFGRPAIDFHLADLWEAGNDRTSFWRTTLDLADNGHALAVAAATATAIQHIEDPRDVERLILDATARAEAVAIVATQLASALGVATPTGRSHAVTSIDAYDTLVGRLGQTWLTSEGGPGSAQGQAIVMLLWELDMLYPLPRAGSATGLHANAIVRLLALAVDDPPAHEWLGERALRFIVGAIPLNPHALPLILRCVDGQVTDAWGLLHLEPVLARLGEIAAIDSTAAGRLAAAPFLFDTSEDRKVPIGRSQILAMSQSWLQAHGWLRRVVAEQSWAAFVSADPVTATETLATVLDHFSTETTRQFQITWHEITGVVSGGRSLELADLKGVSDLLDTSVKALIARASRGTVADEIAIWVARITHPEAWNSLLKASADAPELAHQVQAVLLDSGGLFMHLETRAASIRLASVLSPKLTADQHRQLERVALGLPEAELEGERRRYLERARDQLLVALRRQQVQDEAAKARLAAIDDSNEPPPPPPPMGRWTWVGTRESDERLPWEGLGAAPEVVPEIVKEAMAVAESANADSADDATRWSAVATAVLAASEPLTPDVIVRRLRHQIASLLLRLVGTDRMIPGDPVGDYAAGLLTALESDSPLPPFPEASC